MYRMLRALNVVMIENSSLLCNQPTRLSEDCTTLGSGKHGFIVLRLYFTVLLVVGGTMVVCNKKLSSL